ncbi:Hypothetical_protein [Hexamita inflata]|uniref:Hypothetical_protein n=1 Tax=Hexamita inflata TaxID=28002 RepID=A0ABP1KKW9_9EUKA
MSNTVFLGFCYCNICTAQESNMKDLTDNTLQSKIISGTMIFHLYFDQKYLHKIRNNYLCNLSNVHFIKIDKRLDGDFCSYLYRSIFIHSDLINKSGILSYTTFVNPEPSQYFVIISFILTFTSYLKTCFRQTPSSSTQPEK